MLLFLATALAQSPIERFNGSWTLDKSASDGISDILQAQGLSWFERTLAESGTPTHVIELDPEKYVVHVSSGWYRRTDVLPLDGFTRPTTYARIGEVKVRSERQGDALYTAARVNLRDGTEALLTSTRSLLDDDTLKLVMEFIGPDGKRMAADRIFRRNPTE